LQILVRRAHQSRGLVSIQLGQNRHRETILFVTSLLIFHVLGRTSTICDRIEIINLGGPYGAVTAEHFGQRGVNDDRSR
jgi:hypothetical protein